MLSAGQDGLGAAWADSRPNWEAPAAFLPTLPLLESLSQCDFSGLSFSGLPPSLLPCERPSPPRARTMSLSSLSPGVRLTGVSGSTEGGRGVRILTAQCSVVPKS